MCLLMDYHIAYLYDVSPLSVPNRKKLYDIVGTLPLDN